MNIGALLQDRYRVERVIGQGGGGAVYLCSDRRLSEARWALKELLVPDTTQLEVARTRFQREAAILARVRHPHLPVIIDYFVEGDRHYLVREYVAGETLSERITSRGPASEQEVLHWALAILEVLEYLHGLNPPIIFRDLKPQNVVLSEDGLKLIDFGLARPVGRDRQTMASGSVGYAAPEQWESGAQVDERTDIYALGATLYFLLTGRAPSPVPGQHRVRALRPEVQPVTDQLIGACMSPEPQARPSDLKGLRASLQAALQGASTQAPQRSRPRGRRRRNATGTHPGGIPTWYRGALALATLWFVACLASLWWLPRASPELESEPSPSPAERAGQAELRECAARLAQGQAQAARAQIERLVRDFPHDPWVRVLETDLSLLERQAIKTRLPVLVPLTGSEAENGGWMLEGISLAQVKSPGLWLEVHDTGSQGDQALDAVRKVLGETGYLAVLGPYSSQQTLLLAPLVNSAGLPLLAPSAADTRVAEAGPFVFGASDTNEARVQAVVAYLVAGGARRLVVVSSEDSYLTRSLEEFIEREVARQGAQVVATVGYRLEHPDVDAIATEAARAEAQAVFITDNRGREIAAIARALRSAGVTVPLASQGHPGSRELLAGGAAVDGMLLSSWWDPRQDDPQTDDFLLAYAAWYESRPVPRVVAVAYDATRALYQALAACHTRAQVRAYLAGFGHQRPEFQGVTGAFPLSGRRRSRTAYLVLVEGGAYRYLETPSPTPGSSP